MNQPAAEHVTRKQLAAPSGATMPATSISTTIECTPSQWIERHPDGSFREHAVSVALIPGVDPTSNYAIEQCNHFLGDGLDYVPIEGLYTCPYGDTCTPVSGFPAYPITYEHPVCTWSKGRFWDGNLVIQCMDNWDDKAADGTVLANHSDSWATTSLHTW